MEGSVDTMEGSVDKPFCPLSLPLTCLLLSLPLPFARAGKLVFPKLSLPAADIALSSKMCYPLLKGPRCMNQAFNIYLVRAGY